MKLLSPAAFLFSCLLACSAAAQNRPPAGPPPGPPPAGPPPSGRGPGSPGGPGANAPPSGSGSAGTGASTHTPQHFGPVGRWWDDRSIVQTIGISKDQQKKMDVIFNANKPAILATYKTFLAEQAKLDTLSKQTKVDQAAMFAAIDAVNQARAALEKANTQMLLQIRQQMNADQIEKIEKLH